MKSISRDDARARATSLLDSPNRFILGIVGKPGAGKSTFTQELLDYLPKESVAVLAMDGFHMSNEKLVELGRRDRKGAPDTFDVDDFEHALAEVRNGQGRDFYFPIFDREIEASIPNAGVIPAAVYLIIVEGNYLLHSDSGWDKISSHLNESWFLTVNDEVRLQRLIARHIKFGKTPQEATTWSEGTDEVNARLIEQSRSRADFQVILD